MKNVSNNQDLISFEVFNSFEQLSHLQEEWDQFVKDSDGSIYLTYDWCRIWWRHYGYNREVIIFLFRERENLVGLIPMFVDKLGWKFFNIVIAKIIGSDYTLNICMPPVKSSCAKFVYETVLEYLFNELKCNMVSLGPLLEVKLFQTEDFDNTNKRIKLIERADLGVKIVYILPDDFEKYISNLSKGERKHYRRNFRRLSKNYNLKFECISDSEDLNDVFEDFMEVHQNQWRRLGKLGHFDDWPDAKDFHREMVRVQSSKNRLRIFRLLADGKCIAYRYVYCFGNMYYSYLPARFYGQPWDNFGLGQLTHILTVKRAIEENVNKIAAGRGMYDHKIHLGGNILKVLCVRFTSSMYGDRMKARIIIGISSFIHFFYYRIWFNRISPKLSMKRKALWRVWIRTRI